MPEKNTRPKSKVKAVNITHHLTAIGFCILMVAYNQWHNWVGDRFDLAILLIIVILSIRFTPLKTTYWMILTLLLTIFFYGYLELVLMVFTLLLISMLRARSWAIYNKDVEFFHATSLGSDPSPAVRYTALDILYMLTFLIMDLVCELKLFDPRYFNNFTGLFVHYGY